MVSGFITCIQGCIVSRKHVVAGKVRHSQRMNDPLISVWVIAEKDGTVKSAHCLGCKAGLAESYSHAASVLFYIEALTRIRGKLSCIKVKCTWLLPSFVKEVPYAKMRYINVTSARKLKTDLDEKIENLGENREATSSTGSRRKVTVLGYKKMPNNSKTTWKCTNCKKSIAKLFHDSSADPVSTGQENPVSTTTCSFQSHDSEPEFIELDMYNAQDSDREGESADDIEITMVTICESERHRSLRNLNEQDYQLIMSPHGWLDGAIIHSAHVLLQKINPLIEGFQRPTLGPVQNFSIVSGEFVQLLHTGQDQAQ